MISLQRTSFVTGFTLRMDFAILSSICVYLMLITIYIWKSFYQCYYVEPRMQHHTVELGLEMMPVEQPEQPTALEDKIHQV